MEGFQYSTLLDLNMKCFCVKIFVSATKICMIVLLWEEY